ncbi:beta-ketoacyl-ACP synthase III [Porphyromonas pogonae]|uniref:beta-ketoacyl-ACP synthase III n=1 Tax=Porphyromonas pogonae TaxID=867595 RepID=UPI002E78CC57|nr:beta-ketoacyl-ACP synthase III [Porphyromonas pogonae]
MSNINAVITAVGGYLPPDKLTNADLEKMVDTNDEWITTRVGIKERRILKDPTKGSSYMAIEAAKDLFNRNSVNAEDIEGIIIATNTADYHFPTTASIVAYELGCKNAFTFDMQSACPSFIYALETGANYIRSGRYKKILVIATDKMSAITDYTDRSTCPLFGDAAGCVLLEPTDDEVGVLDSILRTNGIGKDNLIMRAGGSACPPSHETIDRREHFVYQEGSAVFKHAVRDMSSACREVMKRNHLTHDDVAWVVPHQANLRIIDAVARMLEVPEEKVMINIQYIGNTSCATIPICLWQWEDKLHKGDNLILTSFGAGFTWGAVYVKWAYEGKRNN